MALYSGISLMMALLAFATLLGLALGLKCYHCNHFEVDGAVSITPSNIDCNESTGRLKEAPDGGLCFNLYATAISKGKKVLHIVRSFGMDGEGDLSPAGSCKTIDEKGKNFDGKSIFCSCDDKDGCNEVISQKAEFESTTVGCNGVGGFGSDVNVILGFGVIALILGYLRQ